MFVFSFHLNNAVSAGLCKNVFHFPVLTFRFASGVLKDALFLFRFFLKYVDRNGDGECVIFCCFFFKDKCVYDAAIEV